MVEYIEVDYETITNQEKRELRALVNSTLLNGFAREDFDDMIAVIARVVDRVESCGAKMEKAEPANNIEIVRKHLDEPELLTQLAEEAAELAQAALKLRRVLTGINPTPVTEEEASRQVQEKLADVQVCMRALGYIKYEHIALRNEISSRKFSRWAKRLQDKPYE